MKFEAGIPEAPAWLDDDASEEYARVVEIMAKVPGHLQQVDMATVCTYAQAYSDVMRLTQVVRTEGESLSGMKGGSYLNPNCSALAQAHNRMREAAGKLAFTPMDRARSGAKGSTGKAANPMAGFISGPT